MRIIKMQVNGKEFQVVTLRQLAQSLSRQANSLKKLELRGIMPPPNLRMPDKIIKKKDGTTEVRKGYRLYTVEAAKEIKEAYEKYVVWGQPIPHEAKVAFKKILDGELERILKP